MNETVGVKCWAEALTAEWPLSPQRQGSLFLFSNSHTLCSRHMCCQLPLRSLGELFIQKWTLKQSLDRHDTCHDFIFGLQVNYACLSDPTHPPHHHIPVFLFRATPCFPEHLAQSVKQSLFSVDSSDTEWHTVSPWRPGWSSPDM